MANPLREDSPGDDDPADNEAETGSAATPSKASTEGMLLALLAATKTDFAASRTAYESFITSALNEVQDSDFYGDLLELHSSLSKQRVVGEIRAIESWSNGETQLPIVRKSWGSVVDKLYRLNIEDNRVFSNPPNIRTIEEQASGASTARRQVWITPELAHEVADDLLRTKFVAPFVDGVVEISDRITTALDARGLRRFRRFHAKDSGYHARHFYVLIDVPGYEGTESTVTLEIKVLTKLQDTLGELTHLLYEKHRTGEIPLEKKRKIAWELASPDFRATYLGHSAHFLEAAVCDLKEQLQRLESRD